MIEDIKQVLKQEAEAILNIPLTDAFEKAINIIEERVHQRKGKLVASGMGKAGQIALNSSITTCSLPFPVNMMKGVGSPITRRRFRNSMPFMEGIS